MHACCGGGHSAAPDLSARLPNRTWLRRVVSVVEWAVPITALVFVPKCPACVAGYVLLFTGVALSVPSAAALRWVLIGACVATIALLLARRAIGLVRRTRTRWRA